MKVFADTFAFAAWINSRDMHHPLVADYLNHFTGRVVTTEWILTELADGLCHPSSRARACQCIDRVRILPQFEVVPFDAAIYARGYELYANRPDKGWSLTDCISFVVMQREGIADALTADHHFTQAGFNALFQ